MTLCPQGWSDPKDSVEGTSLAVKNHNGLSIYLAVSYHMEKKETKGNILTL